ncbi:DUF6036 family nucleotidyltransferase [Aeoliella sp. SH292]|uniref:DUF6036 family nucleotidyltransferase n=1 Tax=Aeoliella sp. SH292 TaxID=3454464 RepID=UPI003F9B0F82
MARIDELFCDLVGTLDSLNVPYAVMGGFAIRAFSVPRATYDIDIIAKLGEADIASLFEWVEEAEYGWRADSEHNRVLNVAGMPYIQLLAWDRHQSIAADIFLCSCDYHRSVLSRRWQAEINGFKAWIVSVEDLILLKVAAGGLRDISDITERFFCPTEIDQKYLRHWGERMGITERLEQILPLISH